jgi:threonine dehydrogenase-like Zn-dependent dehydrogenase
MKALIINNEPIKLALTKIFSLFNPKAFVGKHSALQLSDIPDPVLPAEDWAVGKTEICGLCGSDYKQVFMNGRIDNPMTSMISWPQVLGHEVVATITKTGNGVSHLKEGQRAVLNPWLSCVTRGLEPCEFCQDGKLAQCLNFDKGHIERGIHHGNSASATGGFAQQVPAHESQWIPIPDDISDEAAVLADPFSVSFHAILKAPPRENGVALVYGCGTLGLLAISILKKIHPTVKVLAVARFDHQADLARQLGADQVFKHSPVKGLVMNVAQATDSQLNTPWMGLPMLNGGVDVVYDTVSSAETMEVDLRITRSFGSVVIIGVEPSKRFEWTPLYFKEINIIGSNGFGIEEFEGQRKHAMEWYFDFIQNKGLDVTPIITHRYSLNNYQDAFMTCYDQGKNGAVKVLFDQFS